MADYLAPDNRAADTDMAILIVTFPVCALWFAARSIVAVLADWRRARG